MNGKGNEHQKGKKRFLPHSFWNYNQINFLFYLFSFLFLFIYFRSYKNVGNNEFDGNKGWILKEIYARCLCQDFVFTFDLDQNLPQISFEYNDGKKSSPPVGTETSGGRPNDVHFGRGDVPYGRQMDVLGTRKVKTISSVQFRPLWTSFSNVQRTSFDPFFHFGRPKDVC